MTFRRDTAPFLIAILLLCLLRPLQAMGDELGASLISGIDDPTADLSDMKKRHSIRVLVNYSKTNFFLMGGKPCGYEYELLQQYGKFLNKGVGKKEKKTQIVFIPVPFERLLPALLEGKGDIAAAGLTITSERQELVAFTDPYLPSVDEIIVTSGKVTGLTGMDDLSGRTVYVLRASSFVQHLREINERLELSDLAPIEIVEVGKSLEIEDILELVNAGVFEMTVCDHHIAELWSAVLTDMTLRHDLKTNTGGQISWAVRKENPELRASLNTFIRQIRKGTLMGNILFKRYFQDTGCIKNPLEAEERRKLDRVIRLFKKYGKRYGFEWQALAAQAYQESGLDHGKKSRHGAVGVMQVLPSTAADPSVNIRNIRRLESNIHAGVKYLAHLRNEYFADSEIEPADQLNFAFAAYNAGPAGIRQLRNRAKAMKLDPNKWFRNVERAALQMNYQETVRYVSNIHKYYIAYKLAFESLEEKAAELKALAD